MIYSQLLANVPLHEIVTSANQFLCRKVAGQKYATLVLCHLSANGELEYVNCGHVPPVVVTAEGVQRPKNCNLPVGLLSEAQFESSKIQLPPGGHFVMVTDGVTEAENTNGDFFGDERLEEACKTATPFENINEAVRAYCGDHPFTDDCTILELSYKG